MSGRGKKSNCTIAGHTLTWAELTVLTQLKSYRASVLEERPIPLREIFPAHNIGDNAKRHAARHLAEIGVLKACGIELEDGIVKAAGRNHTSSDLL